MRTLLLWLLICLPLGAQETLAGPAKIAGPVVMGAGSGTLPAFVQACNAPPASTSANGCTFANPVTSGHDIHVPINYSTSGGVTNVQDTEGNLYTADIAEYHATACGCAGGNIIWYTAVNVIGGSSFAITVNSGSAMVSEMFAIEDSGEATSSPFDVGSNASASTGPTISTGSGTTTQADMVWGVFFMSTNTGATAISPFVTPTGGTQGSTGDIIEYYVQPSAGSQAATATGGANYGSGWGVSMVSYKP